MDKQKATAEALRVLSYSVSSLMLIPLAAMMTALSPLKPDNRFFLLVCLLCMTAGWIGVAAAHIIDAVLAKSSDFVRNIVAVVVGIIVFFALLPAENLLLHVSFENDQLMTVGLAVIGTVAYAYCSVVQANSYYDVLSVKVLYTFAISSAASLLMLRSNGMSMPFIPQLSVIAVLLFLVYWLARNQSNIHDMMKRRQHDMSRLPPQIRTYNIRILLVFFLFSLCALLLRGPILSMLGGAAHQLARLMVNCAGDPSAMQEEEMQPAETPAPGASDAAGGSSILWTVAGVIVIALLLIIWGPYIWRAIRRGLRALRRMILDFLWRHRRKTPGADTGTDEYSDTVELLTGEEKNDLIKTNSRARLRQWKRDVHAFRRMAEGEEKYRTGYALVLEGMEIKNLPILPSDTPLEASEKIRRLLVTVPQMEAATHCYNAIRYALDTSDTDSSNLNSILRTLETMRPLPKMEDMQ